jgi:hypothetical protein
MAMEKQKQLVELLLKRSKQNQLDWQEAIPSDAFQVALSDKTVRIRATPDTDDPGAYDYLIELANSDGRVVDEFSHMTLYYSDATRTSEWMTKMRDLYDMARRKALRSDQLLNEVLSELGDNDVEPF